MIFPDSLSQEENKLGFGYMALSLLVLPSLLNLLPLGEAQLNFIYYCVNFAAVLRIFRRFLRDSLLTALDRPFPTLWYSALGYLGHQTIGKILTILILVIFPGFANVNDQSVAAMLQENFRLMAVGTVLLVPVAEECFYRGLIFRNLYDRSPATAYLVSMVVFSAIHVVGYVGTYEPLHLLLCFIQYLPAGYCLCFAYRRSGTIAAPILLHSVINAVSVYYTMR